MKQKVTLFNGLLIKPEQLRFLALPTAGQERSGAGSRRMFAFRFAVGPTWQPTLCRCLRALGEFFDGCFPAFPLSCFGLQVARPLSE